MKELNYLDSVDDIMELVKEGVFLTVKRRSGEINTMIIGWALLGYFWRTPIMAIAIRPNRYTFQLIENADDFTVSIPFVNLSEASYFCGTQSGRKYNKFTECKLETAKAQKVESPIIKTVGRFYECKIVETAKMNPATLSKDFKDIYVGEDYHTLYFGEVVACYEIE